VDKPSYFLKNILNRTKSKERIRLSKIEEVRGKQVGL
jgi:hypothetical protein